MKGCPLTTFSAVRAALGLTKPQRRRAAFSPPREFAEGKPRTAVVAPDQVRRQWYNRVRRRRVHKGYKVVKCRLPRTNCV